MKEPVKIVKPDASPDASSANAELAGLFSEFASVAMKIAAAFAGQPVALPSAETPSSENFRGYGVSVAEACNAFIISRAKKTVTDKYLRQVRSVLQSFATGRTAMALCDVDINEVEKWIYGNSWEPKTMANNLGTLKTMMLWASNRGWVNKAALSVTRVDLPADTSKQKKIKIHTPEEMATVLETSRVMDFGVMRLLACRYLGGVRSAESHRLDESNILRDHGYIEITAAKAKGGKRRRIIKITPVLAAWLDLGGVLIPTSETTVRRVIEHSGVKWHRNVTRKSWESYSVAATENRASVAKEAGHRVDVQMDIYDAVALPADAKRYFNTFPEPVPRDIKIKQWGGVRRKKAQTDAQSEAELAPP